MVSTTGRPRTPSGTSAPPTFKPPPIPDMPTRPVMKEGARRSSLGLFGKGNKKQQQLAHEQELLRQQRAAANRAPPSLPVLYNGAAPPQLHTFGGEERPDSVAIISGRANPRGYQSAYQGGYQGRQSMEPERVTGMANSMVASKNGNTEFVDPYARTESMTHRGRYSYASSAVSTINSPRRVRRRKDPTPFNVLIIGAQNSGKTSFLNFLKNSLALPQKKRGTRTTEADDDVFATKSTITGSFVSHFLETEIDGERIGLTLWDSEGLEKNVVDLQLRDMSAFVESKFEETFNEEMKVVRAPGVQDTHIHCAFLLLDPARLDKNISTVKARSAVNGNSNGSAGKYGPASTARIIGGLDEDLDLQVLKTLQGKTTVVPVISKADSITTAHMTYLKRMVWDSLRQANLDPLEALGLDDTEGEGRDDRIDEEDEGESDSGSLDVEGPPGMALPLQKPDTSVSGSSPSKQNPSAPTSPNSKRLSHSDSIRQHKRQLSNPTSPNQVSSLPEGEVPYLPLSIISPDIYEPEVIGRKFPWGFADPMNETHCDFLRLKEAVFTEWRGELREASRELWYEGWRTSRLGAGAAGKRGGRKS